MNDAVILACEHAVLRALHHAAIRSPRTGRSNGREYGIPKYLVHTRVQIAASDEECDKLLAGAWDLLRVVLGADDDADRVVARCDDYTRGLLLGRTAPSRADLAGVLHGEPVAH